MHTLTYIHSMHSTQSECSQLCHPCAASVLSLSCPCPVHIPSPYTLYPIPSQHKNYRLLRFLAAVATSASIARIWESCHSALASIPHSGILARLPPQKPLTFPLSSPLARLPPLAGPLRLHPGDVLIDRQPVRKCLNSPAELHRETLHSKALTRPLASVVTRRQHPSDPTPATDMIQRAMQTSPMRLQILSQVPPRTKRLRKRQS